MTNVFMRYGNIDQVCLWHMHICYWELNTCMAEQNPKWT